MTRTTAQSIADLVIVSSAVAAAYVVITTPPLRRIASTAIRVWLGATVPAYLLNEVRRAWAESARAA